MQEFGTGGVRGPPIHGSEQSSLRDSETVLDGVAYRVGAQATCGASDSLGMQRNLHHGCARALVIIPLMSKGLYGYSRALVQEFYILLTNSVSYLTNSYLSRALGMCQGPA